jgi:Ca2+-binding RTX toxin-like protein
MLVAIVGIGDVGAAGEPLGEAQLLTSPDSVDGAEYGTTPAIDGEKLVIGSPYEHWAGEESRGAADPSAVPVLGTCNGLPVTLVVPPGGGRFDGTNGDDVILGTDGPDEIRGLGGNDTICGEGGDDLLLGGPGDDTLLGGDDNDKLRGAAGDDLLLGGAGSDRLLPEIGNDIVDGGSGSDIVDYLAGKGPVTVDLPFGTATYTPPGESWTHTLSLIEKADGTRYDDTLIGNAKRNVLRGKQGVDHIWGFFGDDDLIGGTGDDVISGGLGADLLKGQADNDVMWGDEDGDKLVGGNGNDTLSGGAGDDLLIGGLKTHLGTFFNSLDGGDGVDTCRWEAFTTDCEP